MATLGSTGTRIHPQAQGSPSSPPDKLTEEAPVFHQQLMHSVSSNIESAAAMSHGRLSLDVAKMVHKAKHSSSSSSSNMRMTMTSQSPQPDWSFLQEGVLFGREEEILKLQEAFQSRINQASTRPELVLVSGRSGTGKSALVKNALQDHVKSHNGYFAMGKFDQLTTTSEPYSPFVAALTQLVVAMEEDESYELPLSESLRQIREKLGLEYCKVLGSMVPCLARLLRLPSSGDEEEASAMQDSQQDRLKIALTKFFQAIERPVVLVFDDLQWGDARSLDLVEALIAMNTADTTGENDDNNSSNSSLTVIGICRSNEVPWEHTFAEMLRQLEDEKDAHILHIIVENLTVRQTSALLSRVLRQRKEMCLPLAEIIHDKTAHGNVFFILQLLKALLEEGVLVAEQHPASVGRYNKGYHDLEWMWDDEKWHEFASKQNNSLDALVSQQIQRLPEACQAILEKMACIGAEVELDILVMALRGLANEQSVASEDEGNDENISVDVVKQILAVAMEQDLIVEQLPHRPGRYAFRHDIIQSSAIALIPEEDRSKEHLMIGRILFQQLTPEDLDHNLFLVVNQLVAGIELLTSDIDKCGMSELCVRAGKKSTKRADFDTARSYFDVAASLLPPRYWRDEYHLSLELFCSRAEAECCAADFVAMDATIDEVLNNCRSPKDKMRANLTHLYSLGNRSKLQEAMDLGFQLLAGLGEKFPSKPRLAYLVPELLKVRRRLRSLSDEDIYSLPMLDVYDTEKKSVMSILYQLILYSFCASPDYFPFVVLRGVKLTLKHGLCPLSCSALASYGLVLCAIGEYDDGYRYANLGLKLLQRFPNSRTQILPRLFCVCYGLVFPWKLPVGPTSDPMQHAVAVALDTGDFESAMYLSYNMLTNGYIAGDKLSVCDRRVDQCNQIMSDQGPWLALTKLERQYVDNLMGRSDDPLYLVVEMDSTKIAKHDFELYQYSVFTIRMQLGYHFGDIDMAVFNAKEARKVSGIAEASCYISFLYIYDGMTMLEAARYCEGSRRRKYVSKARSCLQKLETAAKTCPENILHKVHLLRGELKAFNGKLEKAIACFKLAISNAAERGMLQLVAIAHERAAVAFQRLGKTTHHSNQAKQHLNQAIKSYSEWGAVAIVSHLKQSKSDIFDMQLPPLIFPHANDATYDDSGS